MGERLVGVALFLCACGSSGDTGSSDLLAPPPEGEGLQMKIEVSLQPGEEVNVCRFVPVPADLDVGRWEHRMTDISHHFIAYPTAVSNEMAPTELIYGCDENEEVQESRIAFGYGTQSGQGEIVLPEGIAYRAIGGLAWQLEFHLVNWSDHPVDASATVNFWKAEGPIVGEAGLMLLYHDVIAIPAGESTTVRQRCPVAEDIQLVSMVGHFHNYGTGFRASLDGAPLAEPLPLAEVTTIDADATVFDPPLAIAAGQILDYSCDYTNTSGDLVIEGNSARRNEMCALGAVYFKPQGEKMAAAEEICWGEGIVHNGADACMATETCVRAINWSDWTASPRPGDFYELCRSQQCDNTYDAFDACRWESCREACFADSSTYMPTAYRHDDPVCTSCLTEMCGTQQQACVQHSCAS